MYYYIYIRICVFVFETPRTANGTHPSRSATQCLSSRRIAGGEGTTGRGGVENGNVNVFRVNVAANTLADGDLPISRHVNPIPYHRRPRAVAKFCRAFLMAIIWYCNPDTGTRACIRDDNGRIIVQSIDVYTANTIFELRLGLCDNEPMKRLPITL